MLLYNRFAGRAALSETFYPDRIVVGAEDVRAFNLLSDVLSRPLPQKWSRGRGLRASVCLPASAELIKRQQRLLAMKISFYRSLPAWQRRWGPILRR